MHFTTLPRDARRAAGAAVRKAFARATKNVLHKVPFMSGGLCPYIWRAQARQPDQHDNLQVLQVDIMAVLNHSCLAVYLPSTLEPEYRALAVSAVPGRAADIRRTWLRAWEERGLILTPQSWGMWRTRPYWRKLAAANQVDVALLKRVRALIDSGKELYICHAANKVVGKCTIEEEQAPRTFMMEAISNLGYSTRGTMRRVPQEETTFYPTPDEARQRRLDVLDFLIEVLR